MKQKLKKIHAQTGFTLIELLVVISMMVVISTVLIIDFSRQRTVRSMVIAKNELVTNLRKVQSYMLSSRNLPSGEAVKYYIVSFGLDESFYAIHAIDNAYNYHKTIETINLPTGVSIQELLVTGPTKEDYVNYKCMQIIFSAPYGKMYAHGSETCDTDLVPIIQDPFTLVQLNERETIISFTSASRDNVSSVVVTPVTGLITPQ